MTRRQRTPQFKKRESKARFHRRRTPPKKAVNADEFSCEPMDDCYTRLYSVNAEIFDPLWMDKL